MSRERYTKLLRKSDPRIAALLDQGDEFVTIAFRLLWGSREARSCGDSPGHAPEEVVHLVEAATGGEDFQRGAPAECGVRGLEPRSDGRLCKDLLCELKYLAQALHAVPSQSAGGA